MKSDEDIEAWHSRCNDCDYDLSDADELATFLKHFGRRLCDATTPRGSKLWQYDFDPSTPRLNRLHRESCSWLLKAIEIAAPLADQHDFDVAPFLWFERFVDGSENRDREQVVSVRDLIRKMAIRITGRDFGYQGGWYEHDESPIHDLKSPAQLDSPPNERDAEDSTTEAEVIPPEFRTRPMSYRKAAEYLGHPNEDSGVRWLKQCIADGTIRCESLSRTSHVFHRGDFPAKLHERICR